MPTRWRISPRRTEILGAGRVGGRRIAGFGNGLFLLRFGRRLAGFLLGAHQGHGVVEQPLLDRELRLEAGDPVIGGAGGALRGGEPGTLRPQSFERLQALGPTLFEPAPHLGPVAGLLGLGPLRFDRGAAAERPADRREHREHQEHREQEQRHRRDEAGALAGDVAPGQLARPPRQQRQSPPQLAVEMEDAVGKVVPESGEAAVDMPGLAALVAMRPDQRGPAIEAGGALAMPLPGRRLDRARGQPARHRFADAFETPRDHGRQHDGAGGTRRDDLGSGPRPFIPSRACSGRGPRREASWWRGEYRLRVGDWRRPIRRASGTFAHSK
jgi:hypothetical protein